MKQVLRLTAVMVLAAFLAACDDEITTPTTPSGDPVTQTFSGQVTQNDARTHSFEASRAGSVTATLRSISGADAVGFSLGTWNTTTNSCSIVLANDSAAAGAVLTGTMTAAGSLCVRVYDVGRISAGGSAPYTIEVVHP